MGKKINMDMDWKFFLGDLPPQNSVDGWGGAKARAFSFGAASETYDDSKWRGVDVPHDFVIEGDYMQKKSLNADMQNIPEMESMDSRHFAGGSLEGGIGWYRKRFDVPKDCEKKRVYIHFGGVYRDSMVYLNEYYIGRYESGYTDFYYDITDFVNIGGENLLAVRVDATGREGWWYEGGGIYRHVWLEIKEDISAAYHGVFVSSMVNLEQNSAVIEIRTEVENKRFADCNVVVEQIVYDSDRKELAKIKSTVLSQAWDHMFCTQSMELEQVVLWDLENPYLYCLKTNIYANGNLTDTVMTSFGIRKIGFDADKGFFLNGKNRKIKGLCCHHDHAGIGIAANDSVLEYRIAQMKSMGANAYRSAHHMPTDELLELCDRMGMLVFDETRRMSSAPQDLECVGKMVKQARNHPCVFLYGIGNEEIFSQHRPETARTTNTMKREIKKLDPSRPITSAVVCWNGKERFDNGAEYVEVTKHLDIMGFNYCMSAWDDYHQRMPHQPMIITEASSNSGTRGCYNTDEMTGHYYILDEANGDKVANKRKAVKKDMGECEWKYFAERDYLAGIFLWTGMDYRGEPTPLAYPAVYSQFGIMDYCGFPKDNFYYYKSWWADEPTLHIFPHWNLADSIGEKINVHCYSNLDAIELFVNGKSYGKKEMKRNWYLTWENVLYEPGEAVAKGYKDGKEVLTKIVKTTGAPYKIDLNPYKNRIRCGDTGIINVRVTDKEGITVPTADHEIFFDIEGGQFIGTGNGNPGSHESDKMPVRRAFNGLCQLLVKADCQGVMKIGAKSKELIQGICGIKVERQV